MPGSMFPGMATGGGGGGGGGGGAPGTDHMTDNAVNGMWVGQPSNLTGKVNAPSSMMPDQQQQQQHSESGMVT